MNLDTRAREAVKGLHTPVDVESSLSHLRRTRRRRDTGRVVATFLVLASITAGLLMIRDGDDQLPPVDPDPGPVRNGFIINSGAGGRWEEPTPPTLTGMSPYPAWNAFDQASEAFLYNGPSDVFVVGEGGQIAQFPCPPAANCESGSFGPGPDEVTLPATPDGRSLQIVSFDGTVRDTLDLAAVVTASGDAQPQQLLADVGWVPDRTRIAVGTEPESGCDPGTCDSKVWILDPNGGEPQLVYSLPNTPVLVDLAWSPDGRTLGLVVGTTSTSHDANLGLGPQLVTLRFQPGQPVRETTLFRYGDCPNHPGSDCFPSDWASEYAFAWSPDGKRIAVTSGGGVAEISAEDGRELAWHPGTAVHGPLAWLKSE